MYHRGGGGSDGDSGSDDRSDGWVVMRSKNLRSDLTGTFFSCGSRTVRGATVRCRRRSPLP